MSDLLFVPMAKTKQAKVDLIKIELTGCDFGLLITSLDEATFWNNSNGFPASAEAIQVLRNWIIWSAGQTIYSDGTYKYKGGDQK